jgi:hypothetical protein
VPDAALSAGAGRQVAGAAVRYYARMGRLALRLADVLVPVAGEQRQSVPAPSAPSRVRPSDPQTIVIEAASGRSGLGVFMVENTTSQKVSAPVSVSAFADDSGREAQPRVRFSPAEITLDPGDQVLVQVAATVNRTFEPGVRYKAEIAIPQLARAGIPIVVRRRAAARRA